MWAGRLTRNTPCRTQPRRLSSISADWARYSCTGPVRAARHAPPRDHRRPRHGGGCPGPGAVRPPRGRRGRLLDCGHGHKTRLDRLGTGMYLLVTGILEERHARRHPGVGWSWDGGTLGCGPPRQRRSGGSGAVPTSSSAPATCARQPHRRPDAGHCRDHRPGHHRPLPGASSPASTASSAASPCWAAGSGARNLTRPVASGDPR